MPRPVVRLPQDEGPHDLPVEWWYWTAHLHDAQDRAYAAMCVLFKASLAKLKDIYFAHWFVSDISRQTFRPSLHVFWRGLGPASFKGGRLDVKAGHVLSMRHMSDDLYSLRTPMMDLRLRQTKPPLLIGQGGRVDLHTTYTYYYSLPRLVAQGTIKVRGKNVKVKGMGWMDHQWSPVTFDREHAWKWFSMQLDDGTDLQCFEYGRTDLVRLATISWPDGHQQTCRVVNLNPLDETWTSRRSGASYGLAWEIQIPQAQIHVTCWPKAKRQEIVHGPFRYWEGPLSITGRIQGRTVQGDGFLELNGVASRRSYLKKIYELAPKRYLKLIGLK